jgi:hypothetical protein
VNDTNQARPPRPSRTRAAITAREKPGSEPALSAIPPQPGYANDGQAPHEEPPARAGDGARWGRITQVASAKRRWIVAGGAVAAGIPAGPGLAWAIAGRPDAVRLLVAAALVALATGIPYVAAAMYQARQETRRKEIECHPANTLADALARSLDDAHVSPQNLSGAEAIEEARRVRKDARLLIDGMTPVVSVLLEQARTHLGQPAEGPPGG